MTPIINIIPLELCQFLSSIYLYLKLLLYDNLKFAYSAHCDKQVHQVQFPPLLHYCLCNLILIMPKPSMERHHLRCIKRHVHDQQIIYG